MDARLVWDTWRRVLTNDELVEKVLHAEGVDFIALGFSADEARVLADYASTSRAAEVTVGMYRRLLRSNARSALNLVPLVRRLVDTCGVDASTVAVDYVKYSGYRDDGPNFWRLASAFIDFLTKHPSFATPQKQGILLLEGAAAQLVRHIAERTSVRSGAGEAADSTSRPERFIQSGFATVVHTTHDFTPWIEAPSEFDCSMELDAGQFHWLVYVTDPESAHAYAEVSAEAVQILGLLVTPQTVAELSAACDLPAAEVEEVVLSLEEIGAIARTRDPRVRP